MPENSRPYRRRTSALRSLSLTLALVLTWVFLHVGCASIKYNSKYDSEVRHDPLPLKTAINVLVTPKLREDWDDSSRKGRLEAIRQSFQAALKADLAAYLNVSPNSGVMMVIRWLGLLDDEVVSGNTVLDVLAEQMLARMAYRPGERDMVVLLHDFVAAYEDRREHITSTMVDYGIPGGETSMARTVGLPAAVAGRMILEGEIVETGVHIPVLPQIYEPVLTELERLGIAMQEQTEPA